MEPEEQLVSDSLEIDFLNTQSDKSGDAITIRYLSDGKQFVHVVDAGYKKTAEHISNHIRDYYDTDCIDHLVVTHPDGDHAGGIVPLIEKFEVKNLWMLRPWIYTDILLEYFTTYNSEKYLAQTLRKAYPLIAEVEEAALDNDISIKDPLQNAKIGLFTVLSPTLGHYLCQVLHSDKTPDAKIQASSTFIAKFPRIIKDAAKLVVSSWGVERFPSEETSPENEMSVIQFLNHCDRKILLTADAGRQSLEIARKFAPQVGLKLPGIDCFQVPHHGSSKNVNTALLDKWLGPKLQNRLPYEKLKFCAIISAAKNDPTHPRKAVTRAMWHRKAHVTSTENGGMLFKVNCSRSGWSSVSPLPYPETQEIE